MYEFATCLHYPNNVHLVYLIRKPKTGTPHKICNNCGDAWNLLTISKYYTNVWTLSKPIDFEKLQFSVRMKINKYTSTTYSEEIEYRSNQTVAKAKHLILKIEGNSKETRFSINT